MGTMLGDQSGAKVAGGGGGGGESCMRSKTTPGMWKGLGMKSSKSSPLSANRIHCRSTTSRMLRRRGKRRRTRAWGGRRKRARRRR